MRSRNIKPGFFSNEHIGELPPEARLLFIGLWVLADCRGILEDRPRRIGAQIFPFNDYDVEALLNLLNDCSMVVRYAVKEQRCIVIPSFIKHQNPHPREKPNSLPAPTSDGATDSRGNKFQYTASPAESLLLNPESLLLNPIEPYGSTLGSVASVEGSVTQAELDKIVAAWNVTPGVRQCTKLSAKRRKALRTRLADADWRESWEAALAKFPLKCFQQEDSWVPFFDWFIRPDTVTSILEGKYDWSKSQPAPPKKNYAPLPLLGDA